MPADIQYVLELVNQARAVADLAPMNDLPKGKCADGDCCPIALALPGNPLVQGEDILWETFPGDSLPERIAKQWAESVMVIHDRENHLAAYVVNTPREMSRWIAEFDRSFDLTWAAYRGT